MFYHFVLELGMFREYGTREDTDAVLKTLERAAKRRRWSGLCAVVERYRMEQLADGDDLTAKPVFLP
eukprot:11171282-Lingulodinium_polyedra.AAC.1